MSSSQSEDLLDKLDRKRNEYRESYDRRRVEYRDRINRNVNRALTPSSDNNIIYRSWRVINNLYQFVVFLTFVEKF